MMTDAITGSRIAVVVFGSVSISGATLAPAPRRRAQSNSDACAGCYWQDAHVLANATATTRHDRGQPRGRNAVERRPGDWPDLEAGRRDRWA